MTTDAPSQPVALEPAEPVPAQDRPRWQVRPPSRKWRHGWQFLQAVLRLADAGILAAAALSAHAALEGSLDRAEGGLLAVAVAIAVLALSAAGAYEPGALKRPREHWDRPLLAALGASALLAAVAALGAAGHAPAWGWGNWGWIAASLALAAVPLAVARLLMAAAIAALMRAGHLRKRVVLVGGGRAARRIAGRLAEGEPEIAFLGIFADRLPAQGDPMDALPLLGGIDDLMAFVRAHSVDRVILTLPRGDEARTVALLKRLRTVPVRIDVAAHPALWGFGGAGIERVGGVPVITVANLRVDDQIGWAKRIEDVVLSLVMLTLLAPLMLALAVMIRLDSPGPALFRQQRFGYNNTVFRVFKFRTMRNDPAAEAAAASVPQATRDDPRITRLGRVLRRTSLDELPQLFNVLLGSMSLVGPRPHAVPHNIRYGAVIEEYFARHNVKPGITGWAQVNGLRGETDTDEKMQQRINFDLYYIEHWSLLFDLRIIALTAIRIWFQKTAY